MITAHDDKLDISVSASTIHECMDNGKHGCIPEPPDTSLPPRTPSNILGSRCTRRLLHRRHRRCTLSATGVVPTPVVTAFVIATAPAISPVEPLLLQNPILRARVRREFPHTGRRWSIETLHIKIQQQGRRRKPKSKSKFRGGGLKSLWIIENDEERGCWEEDPFMFYLLLRGSHFFYRIFHGLVFWFCVYLCF